MARRRQPRTLHEWNAALAAYALRQEVPERERKPLSVMQQAKLLVRAMPKAVRVGEFIGMWAIAKNERGSVTVEDLVEYWEEPQRTMYRRLSEFRELWGPLGHQTPDAIADELIADYRRRLERLTARDLPGVMGVPVAVPGSILPSL